MQPAEPDVALIRSCRLFAGLGAEDLGSLARIARRRRWPADTVIFQRGDVGREMIIVVAGRIRLSVLSAEGRELSLRHAEAGQVIGEMAVLDGGPRSADATAVVDSEGLSIARADLDRLVAERPGMAVAFVRYLSARLRETTDQLESIALYRLDARLARFLLGLLRQQNAKATGTVTLRMPFNQSEIADIVGASRPKVNRALVELEEAGAITRSDTGFVCRIERLADIAGSADGG